MRAKENTAELDALVRRVDEDRWLASRFAPPEARARLAALYALTHEIAKTAEAVTQEGLGDIRLAWWREAVNDIYAGAGPKRAHHVVAEYARAVEASGLPRAPLDAMIDARVHDLEAAPFATWDALDAYLDATAGNVIRLALAACGAPNADAFARTAGLAWGYAGVLRAAPFWRARGRNVLPGGARDALARGRAALEATRELARALPSEAFPAYGYVTLARSYYRALAQGAARAETPLLVRQVKLVWASASGRL